MTTPKLRPTSRRSIFAAAFAATLLAAGPAAAEALRVQLPATGDRISLVQNGQRWQLEQSGGQQATAKVELPVRSGARFTDLRPVGASWLAAGVERAQTSSSLLLLRGQGTSVEVLPTPAHDSRSVLLQPNALADAKGLAAMVWIEGVDPRQGAVKAARYDGVRWSAPTVISPVGQGSQTALRAITLDDGTFLAVWAAFDGRDDEIAWSRFDGSQWSAPKILSANTVPDVTPAVRAIEGGALLVWSFYDGNDYRLRAATFRNGAFEETQIFGGKGSTFPVFADAAQPTVVFHQAVPAEWQIVELDTRGKAVRWASVPAVRRQPPSIQSTDAANVELHWPGIDPVKLPWQPFAQP